MASTSSTEKDKGPTQSASVAGESRPSAPESSSQRQTNLGTSQNVYPAAARLQPGWETMQSFGGQGQQPINAAYMPGAQTVWPPGAVPFLHPQVYMYPGLPGNPPTFFPAGSLHPTQRPMPQMLPHLGMVVAGQQFPVNSMLPFNMTPASTQEAWLQARNMRPQPGMVQGMRPTGWGGIPFQSQQAQQHQRWQQSQRQEVANVSSRRPDRMQAQPPPPPPRASSTPQSAQMHKDLAPAGVLPPVSELLQAGRASSLPHLEQQQQQQQSPQPPQLRQAEQHQQQQPQELASSHPAYPAAASPGPSGKVPCAFFLKTGTCAYGDK